MKNQPAALRQVAAKDEKTRNVIENIDPSFEVDAKTALNEINDDEMEEMLSEMLLLSRKKLGKMDQEC